MNERICGHKRGTPRRTEDRAQVATVGPPQLCGLSLLCVETDEGLDVHVCLLCSPAHSESHSVDCFFLLLRGTNLVYPSQWWQGWHDGWKGWDDSTQAAASAQIPDQVSDERVATVLHAVQDTVQQTTVIAHGRCFQSTQYRVRRETQLTRPWKLSPKRVNDKRRSSGSTTIWPTRSQKPRQTTRMPHRTSSRKPRSLKCEDGGGRSLWRPRMLISSILERHEEAQKHLNALTTQFITAGTSVETEPRAS